MCVVRATSVLPSHLPVVKPPRVCSAYFDGCGRPSIQIVIGARSSQRADGVGDRAALDRIVSLQILQTERTLHEVERRPSLALPLDHRQLRFVVAQRPGAPLVVQRQADVVDRIRVARDVFGVARRPRADELDLRKGAATQMPAARAATSAERRSVTIVAEHGVGSHLEPSASFLKCELTMNGCSQIPRIVDDGRDDEHLAAVGSVATVEVFGDRRVRRCTARRSCADIRRACSSSRPSAILRPRRSAASAAAVPIARSSRPATSACPSALAAGPNRKSRVCVPASVSTLQRVVVLPGDVEPAGHAHDRGGTIRLALLAGCLVGGRIPGVDDLQRFLRDRDAAVVALGRRHHAVAPVFVDEGHPVAGEIDRRRCLARLVAVPLRPPRP